VRDGAQVDQIEVVLRVFNNVVLPSSTYAMLHCVAFARQVRRAGLAILRLPCFVALRTVGAPRTRMVVRHDVVRRVVLSHKFATEALVTVYICPSANDQMKRLGQKVTNSHFALFERADIKVYS
jgi:hypothetical protein